MQTKTPDDSHSNYSRSISPPIKGRAIAFLSRKKTHPSRSCLASFPRVRAPRKDNARYIRFCWEQTEIVSNKSRQSTSEQSRLQQSTTSVQSLSLAGAAGRATILARAQSLVSEHTLEEEEEPNTAVRAQLENAAAPVAVAATLKVHGSEKSEGLRKERQARIIHHTKVGMDVSVSGVISAKNARSRALLHEERNGWMHR
ncbi:hypothetical protein TSAR_001107 [Trichomalopsis sarcophagae]|uniref:Uncharacterized protein n=1 Tax=Trichomalopsis sarcophagae TaxID=543379 RepID=A0A232FHJ2_9HYME|nr:hypothetical protein TSAR_001107 [Trichomalopsis sarcophagae]